MQLELKALQAQVGITFIYVTHDQEEALTMSDRIAVLNHGRVLQVGPPFEIYERPTSRFVADFIGDSNFVNGRVLAVQGQHASVQLDGSDHKVMGLCQGDLVVGDPVTVSIRPEKIQINREPEHGGQVISGRVENTAYVGADTRLVVQAGNGIQFRVWEHNRSAVMDSRQMYSPGQELWLSFSPENTLVLPKE
jgi:spermidine/putrescine transport system ATP-binding protein